MKSRLSKYIFDAKIMQLATSKDNQPWVCSVYFVADEDLNLYWLSWPSRRHSQEVKSNSNVAITMQLKTDLPVIGIQAEGHAEVVKDRATVKKMMEEYIRKYKSGKQFYDRFIQGTNEHRMYKFTPKNYVLFDEVNSKDNPRIEISIGGNIK